MIKYTLTEQGQARNIQRCPSDYVAKEGETLVDIDKVPLDDSAEHLALNSQAYRDFLVATQYQRNRRYPSIGDQLDMIYKDNLNSTTTHKDAVEAVKTKWPKDNSGPVE